MVGEQILARSIDAAGLLGPAARPGRRKRGPTLRRVAAWTLLLDLMIHCDELRQAAERSWIGYRFDHVRRGPVDVAFDLVVTALPRWCATAHAGALYAELAEVWSLPLQRDERVRLDALPAVLPDPTGAAAAVLLAIKVSVCLRSHSRVLPGLHAEVLASGMLAKRPPARYASAAYVLVDDALPIQGARRTGATDGPRRASEAARVIDVLESALPRAGATGLPAHDAIGVTLLSCSRGGSPTRLSDDWNVVRRIDRLCRYENMVDALVQAYVGRFGRPVPLRALALGA